MTNMSTVNEFHQAVQNRDTSKIQNLLSEVININIQDEASGETGLHICSRLGYLDIAEMLLPSKPYLHLVNKNGWNPLHVAVYYKSDSVAKAICESKPNLDIVNLGTQKATSIKEEDSKLVHEFPVGTTPVHMALLNKSIELFEYFLQFNVNIFLKDELGRTALDIAENQVPVGTQLSADGCNILGIIARKSSSLCHAIKGEHPDKAKLLINNGADVNELDNKRYTALYLAVRKSQIDIIKMLIKGGCDVNAKIYHTEYTRRYEQGLTALHFACQQSNVDIVQILTEDGADVNAIDAHHYSPLHSICKQQASTLHKDTDGRVLVIVKNLLEHGAIVNNSVGNSKGFTPLEMVASSRLPSSNYTKPVSIVLMSAGAVLPEMNTKQRENLELKLMESSCDVLHFFLEYGYKFNSTYKDGQEDDKIELVKKYKTEAPTLLVLATRVIRLQMQSSSCPNIWYGVKRLELPSNFDRNIITLNNKELESPAK